MTGMDDIIAYMKHHGWREEGRHVRGPKGEIQLDWVDAIKYVLFCGFEAEKQET